MKRGSEMVVKFLLAPILVAVGGLALASSERTALGPVTVIMNVDGQVEYTRNGKKWKRVRRNKFLFPGYQVRTGADGKGTFLNQVTGMSRDLGADSVVEIAAEGAVAVNGFLSDPREGRGSLVASLGNRFKKAQKYTTVRRGVNKEMRLKLKTATHKKRSAYLLSAAWPELVWNNEGGEYRYRLTVDEQSFEVPSSEGETVHFALSGMAPGKHLYGVEVLKGDEVVYRPKKRSSFIWLSPEEEQAMVNSLPTDDLMRAMVLDGEGVLVGSLKLYQHFFEGNRDDNDMRPMLIQNLHNLKLSNLKKAEAQLFNLIRSEEE